MAARLSGTFNRTNVELKRVPVVAAQVAEGTFNRTNVELKRKAQIGSGLLHGEALIEPMWN